MKKTNEQKSLEDYKFDDSIDFFGIKTDDVVEPKKEEETKTKPEEEEEEKEEEEPTFNYGEEDTEEEVVEFSSVITSLKEKGIFTEEDEVDDSSFISTLEDKIDVLSTKKADEIVDSYMNDLDEDAKEFLKFKMNGGNTADFFKVVSTPKFDSIDELDDQEKFLNFYLAQYENMESDEIEERIEYLKDTDKIETISKKYFSKYNKQIEDEKKLVIKKQEQIKAEEEEKRQLLITSLTDEIKGTESVSEILFDDADKKELIPFITKVKTINGSYMTPFQAKMQEIFNDKKKLLLLAKIVKEDLSLDSIKKQLKSNVTKEVSKTINNKNRRSDYSPKSLADRFN